MNRYEAVKRIRQWHRDADDIRLEGKCPSCKQKTLYSYVLPDDTTRMLTVRGRAKEMENCGFYCPGCHWGNAGSRENWDHEPTAEETGPQKVIGVRYRP